MRLRPFMLSLALIAAGRDGALAAERSPPSWYTGLPPCRTVFTDSSFRAYRRSVRPPAEPIWNRVVVRRAEHYVWNGSVIDGHRLDQYLQITNSMNPAPVLIMAFDRGLSESDRRTAALTVAGALQCRPDRAVFGF